MEKIGFENFPSTNTPISAENLNLLQDNVETAIDGIVDEIVESGNNQNGRYIKFASGDMICFGKNQGTNQGFTTVTFPQQFVKVDAVNAIVIDSTTNYFIGVNVTDVTNINAKFSIKYVQFGTNNWGIGSNQFYYMAIGSWK